MQIGKENWFMIGDLHRDARPIEVFYQLNRERLNLDQTQSNIISLGDVGANYSITGKGDYDFKKALSKYPFTFICLRGNHEARVSEVMRKYPERWKSLEKYGGKIYIEEEFPNIEYLEDGPAVYEFAGYKTLSLPGAYSVDKWFRLRNNWAWYNDEQLSNEEKELGKKLAKENSPFDLVISHTCPIMFEPRDLFLSSINQNLVDKSMERFLGEIEATLEYKRWAWGHFHSDRLYPWDGDKEKLMLANGKVVDLYKFINMKKTDCLKDILA